jgi:2-oxoglutarate dehydrogenase E1 component
MRPTFYHLDMLEPLYERYVENDQALDPSWREIFQSWGVANHAEYIGNGISAYRLVEAYRKDGHLLAACNPLALYTAPIPPQLQLATYCLQNGELVPSFGFFLEQAEVTAEQLLAALQKIYSAKIGFEYLSGEFLEIESWIQSQIEPTFSIRVSEKLQRKLLWGLTRAELFERFIHTKYAGQKRFSLEGLETLIPCLSLLLEEAELHGVHEVGIGMSHRGRLNVLAHILQKPYSEIFAEFEERDRRIQEHSGDVKYHKGYDTHYGAMRLFLSPNPSHLESVDPVIEGRVRARQVICGENFQEVLPILIHGDAAVAGQGVVYETMQFQRIRGFATGGTIHIIANNQIGFTTSPEEFRSTRYSTDLAKAFSSPVFHVNAEDPEGCAKSIILAVRLRQKFGCDVLLDLNGYRKYGHNEGDEPFFTQPIEYKKIKEKPSIRTLYTDQLVSEKILTLEEAKAMEVEIQNSLAEACLRISGEALQFACRDPGEAMYPIPLKTSVEIATLKGLIQELAHIPDGFVLHPKVQKLLQMRSEAHQIDWATAELLSYATLLQDGVSLRIVGQDVQRGTFSHRHSVLIDQNRGNKYVPLANLKSAKARFDIYNSILSELAVLGFEFGYSVEAKNALVIWEAQYGDFANAAQLYIDQYLAASEEKWNLSSNITLLLPHGYEGAGPEHSSARIERFLQLSGESNMRIANVSTPAQLFHLLRGQALDEVRKPLILFTPKALLRHPLVISSFEELADGAFYPVLEEQTPGRDEATLILCSGKIYYDLFAERSKRQVENDYRLIRIELLYPFHEEYVEALFSRYPKAKIVWVQEEHRNMGAYAFLRPKLERLAGDRRVGCIARKESASTAAGSSRLHKQQLQSIFDQVFA